MGEWNKLDRVIRNRLNKKKILVSGIGYDQGYSGLSSYIYETIKIMESKYFVTIILLDKDYIKFPKEKFKNLKYIRLPKIFNLAILNVILHTFFLPILTYTKKWEVLFLAAGNRRLVIYSTIPIISTFHDFSQLYVRGKYDKLRMFYIKYFLPFFINKIQKIFVISRSTKIDMEKFFNCEKKINLNHLGFTQMEIPTSLDSFESFSSKQSMKKNYILYVSRIEHPGKNHVNLLRAYSLLPEKLKEKYDLIFIGKEWSGSEIVKQEIDNVSLEKNVHIFGFVSDDDLYHFYKYASLFVFPSFYEGFGIPILEAMGHNIPVVCSDRASLPEVGGDAALLFNPDDPKDIASKMSQVLDDENFKNDLVIKGRENIKRFCWEKHVNTLFEGL